MISDIIKSLGMVAQRRGVMHLLCFIFNDFVGNQLKVPINGHRKELLFWEKQAVGLGNFAHNFSVKVDRLRQREIFPDHLLPLFDILSTLNNSCPISVLDVGAGPVSLLTWAHHQGMIALTASDFLLDEYNLLLHAYNYQQAVDGITFISTPGEQLVNSIGSMKFDLVFCNNALDHMDSPEIVLGQMVEVTLPGGFIVVSGRSREGSNEKWDGIHKHDLYLENSKLMMAGQVGVSRDLGANLPVIPFKYTVPTDKFGDMIIVYKKLTI